MLAVGALLRLAHGGVLPALLRRGVALEKSARHVAAVVRRVDSREYVDDDEFIGAQRAVAALVAVHTLILPATMVPFGHAAGVDAGEAFTISARSTSDVGIGLSI